MSNLFILVKTNLRESLDTRQFKENRGKTISFLTLLIIVGVVAVVLSSFYNLSFVMICLEGELDPVHSTAAIGGIASFLVLFTSVVRAKSIYVSKDYEMLRSMPLKKSEIVGSKIIGMYLIELLYTAVLMLPNGVIAAVFSGNILYFLSSIVITLLIPGLPIIIGCVLGIFVALIADRTKIGNFLSIIFYIAFFALIFAGSFYMGGGIGSGIVDEVTGEVSFTGFGAFEYLNPTLLFVEYAFTKNPLWYLAFIGTNAVALAVAVAFIAKMFDIVYAVANSAASSVKYVKKELQQKGLFSTLFRHEIKRYFSSRLYCINTMVSGICAVALIVFMGFSFSGFEDVEMGQWLSEYAFAGTLVIIFAIGIATPASISISMEGRNFWLIKTLPINYKTLVRVKLCMSELILGIFSVVASILCIVFCKPNAVVSVLIVATPLFYIWGASCTGLLINLNYYKLKWINEQEVVKNSAAVIISMLVDFGLTIVFVGLTVLSAIVNAVLAAAVLAVLNIGFAVVAYILLMLFAEEKIRKIEDF